LNRNKDFSGELWIMDDREIEVKLFVNDLAAVENWLITAGAKCVQKRTHELNLRFDTPDLILTKAGKALRLRSDTAARLTFKGPNQTDEGVSIRQEIEFEASDYHSAQAFLIALGYQVIFIYEKHRTTYDYQDMHISLDELPYGRFVEIEGVTPEGIKSLVQRIGLSWDTRIFQSYVVLFEQLRQAQQLPFRDLLYENFSTYRPTPQELGVAAADS
jgi:adenylate cyclase class 2